MAKRAMVNNTEGRKKYNIESEATMGVCLSPTDVKGFKAGNVDISRAWCTIVNKELYIVNMRIKGSAVKDENGKLISPNRKLLEHRDALDKMCSRVFKDRLAIVPLELSVTEEGLLKVTVGLGKRNPDYVAPVRGYTPHTKKPSYNKGGYHKGNGGKFRGNNYHKRG